MAGALATVTARLDAMVKMTQPRETSWEPHGGSSLSRLEAGRLDVCTRVRTPMSHAAFGEEVLDRRRVM